MGNKTPRPVEPSKIEAVSDNVDVKFKGRLLSVEVTLKCDPNTDECTVPFGTKFVLITENDWEPTTSTKVITVYMICSFTDGTTKLNSDKIRHVLEEKFQSEGQLQINVHVLYTTENQAGKTLSTSNTITLDINVYGINITHEEIYQAIATYLGPEYKLDMTELTQDHICIKGVLISEEISLSSNGTGYVVVPKGTGFILYLSEYDESQEKRCQVYSTKEDVTLSYTNVENVDIFTADVSPFILQKDMDVSPFLAVYLICYFEITDTSLFNTDNIAAFLIQTYQPNSSQTIVCRVYEVESIPKTVSPPDSQLIGFDCQILRLEITVENVHLRISEYFGPSYIVLPPH